MSDILNIKITKRISGKIREFEKREWHTADMEHYGRDIDFKKKEYKFVATNNDGDILGILVLVIQANVGLIESLLIDSKYRGQGVGKKLMVKAESFAKKNNCTKVWLETDEGWEAEKFYKKINYEVTGIHEKHFFNKKGLIFTKYL